MTHTICVYRSTGAPEIDPLIDIKQIKTLFPAAEEVIIVFLCLSVRLCKWTAEL